MIRIRSGVLITFFLSALLGAAAKAQTINAASCSESDVASALASVAADGTTVNIPSGTCTWTTALNYTQTYSMSVIGHSTIATNDSYGNPATFNDTTEIIDNVTHSGTDYTIQITTAAGKSFRLSGISVFANGSSTTSNNGVVSIRGTSQAVRIDHCHFYKNYIDQLTFWTQVYGVVDHCLFDNSDLGIEHRASGWNASSPGTGSVNGDGSWNDTTTLGSNRFMFVENSTINSTRTTGNPTPGMDCFTGGRYVYRFDSFIGGAALQTHPTGHAGDDRGCRAWEIYGNNFSNATNSNPEFNFDFISSGTGVIWGNTVNGSENFVTLHAMRSDNTTYTQTPPPNGWGYCGTQVNGTGSSWDQNTSSVTGYACLDQPGRGVGDLLSGNFPTKCDSTTGCTTYNGAWPNQAVEPIYEWMDSWTGVSGYPGSFWNLYDPGDFSNNRDYYLWCNPASLSGCTSFNGTVGVGSGPLATRPSTCTAGVAYWATDQGSWNQSGSGGQGQLYACSATNTWTVYYTPYAYPHALTQDPPAAPSPPTNLAATVN